MSESSDENKLIQAKQQAKRVHDLLVPVLAELHGNSVKVQDSFDSESGLITYAFDDAGCRCTAAVALHNERAAIVGVFAKLGRMYTGFVRALRWLACNRAGNTVAIQAGPDTLANRELYVGASRVIHANDGEGLREMLLDLREELVRLRRALKPWFPELLEGAVLAQIEDEIRLGDHIEHAALLASPKDFLRQLKEDAEAAQYIDPRYPIVVAGWLGQWETQLSWLDKVLGNGSAGELSREEKRALLGEKATALMWLNRHEEVLALADQLEQLVDESQRVALGTIRSRALYGLERYDELLENVQGADYDGEARIWFWRSLANARLGNIDAAHACYLEYEAKVGCDIIGREMLVKAWPSEDESAPRAAA